MRQRLGLARCGPPRRPRPLLWWLQRYFHVGRGTPRMAVPPRPSGEPPPPPHAQACLAPLQKPCCPVPTAVSCSQSPISQVHSAAPPALFSCGPRGRIDPFWTLDIQQGQATGQGAPPCPASPHYSALRLQLRPTLTRPQCHQGGLKGSICPSFH